MRWIFRFSGILIFVFLLSFLSPVIYLVRRSQAPSASIVIASLDATNTSHFRVDLSGSYCNTPGCYVVSYIIRGSTTIYAIDSHSIWPHFTLHWTTQIESGDILVVELQPNLAHKELEISFIPSLGFVNVNVNDTNIGLSVSASHLPRLHYLVYTLVNTYSDQTPYPFDPPSALIGYSFVTFSGFNPTTSATFRVDLLSNGIVLASDEKEYQVTCMRYLDGSLFKETLGLFPVQVNNSVITLTSYGDALNYVQNITGLNLVLDSARGCFYTVGNVTLVDLYVISLVPTQAPTTSPSHAPTVSPAHFPTTTPTGRPTRSPTSRPTPRPTTLRPTTSPTIPAPTGSPSTRPTRTPTTLSPTFAPTVPPIPIIAPLDLLPGEQFYMIFVTVGQIPATSLNCPSYDAFVIAETSGYSWNGSRVTWPAICCNSMQNAAINGTRPVYTPNGIRVANQLSDLWNGTLLSVPGVYIDGTLALGNAWTGCLTDGTCDAINCVGQGTPFGGNVSSTTQWLSYANFNVSTNLSIYGLSPLLSVPYPLAIELPTPYGLFQGSPFYFLFQTSTLVAANVSNCSYYDRLAQLEGLAYTYNGSYITWRVICCSPSRNGTSILPLSPYPVYLAGKNQRLALDVVDIWATAPTVANYTLEDTPSYLLNGTSNAFTVWTGCNANGTGSAGSYFGDANVITGMSGFTNDDWINAATVASSNSFALYAVSNLQVALFVQATKRPTTMAPTLIAPTQAPSTAAPSLEPTTRPSAAPTTQFPTTLSPTILFPTFVPSQNPTSRPTTLAPTGIPTTLAPTTLFPTMMAEVNTAAPSWAPSVSPTEGPTTLAPTEGPTTLAPTLTPTTASPTKAPTAAPI